MVVGSAYFIIVLSGGSELKIFSVFFLVLASCGEGFSPYVYQESSEINKVKLENSPDSSFPDNETEVIDDSNSEETPPQKNPPVAKILETMVIQGENNALQTVIWDHEKEELKEVNQVRFNSNSRGSLQWMEKTEDSVFVLQSTSSFGEIHRFQLENGKLLQKESTRVQNSAVHFSITQEGLMSWLFHVSSFVSRTYVGSAYESYRFSSNQWSKKKTLSFPDGSKTHASFYDKKMDNLWVVNTENHSVDVFNGNTLDSSSPKKSFNIRSPRIIVGHPTLSVVYVVTEDRQNKSRVYGFQTNGSGLIEEVGYTELNGYYGAAIKFNEKYNYLIASTRQQGGIDIIPLTKEGRFSDQTEKYTHFSYDESCRTLSMSDDFHYAFISFESSEEIAVIKFTDDSNGNLSDIIDLGRFSTGQRVKSQLAVKIR